MLTAGPFRRFFAELADGPFLFLLTMPFALFVLRMSQADARDLGYVVMFFYFSLLESSRWQRTLGQKCLRIYVCSTSNERLSFWRASFRQILRPVVVFAVSFPFGCVVAFVVLLGQNPPGWLNPTLAMVGFAFFWITTLFIALYVRLFNNGQQTICDYLSKSLMVVSPKK